MKARVVVHLVNGEAVAGGAEELTDVQVTTFKQQMADIAGSIPADGWQINIESPNGSWAVFPKESVLWVEIERVE